MSSGGAALQLIARGRQDIYLVGNPQITFFKQVYRRYTNFSMESQPIYFDGTANFGRRISAIIPRKGDLLHRMMLEISLPMVVVGDPDTSWVNAVGHAIIEEVTIEIGEKEIDKQTGEWLHVWSSLTTSASKQTAYYNMIGRQTAYTQDAQPGPIKLYIPLRFWFCNNIGMSLPLIALQTHPVRLTVKFRDLQQLFYRNSLQSNCTQTIDQVNITDVTLYGDYIYLDIEERRKFASVKHEYLIEQVQFSPLNSIPANASVANIPLNFNHPIKELIWVVQQTRMGDTNEIFNYSSLQLNEAGRPYDLILDAVIKFDGFDRFKKRDISYFRLVQPWQYHTTVPDDFIYLYSFSVNPEDSQPSGSFNASRLDSIVLTLTMNNYLNNTNASMFIAPIAQKDATCVVYAVNYNVLRIVAGMGACLFIA
jgi:Major capsid protein N-terminus/Large eukaryotic DNA virus major capsid protein